MAYLGKQPAVQGKDAGPAQRLDNVSSSFNGTLTAFDMTLDGTTVTPHINNLAIYLNGVYQEPDNAYILSGSQMKFSEAPTSGMSFQGSILGDRRLMTPDNDTLKAAMVSSDLRTAISGSFTTVSSSLASRITSEEGEAEGTVISSSAQVTANLPTGTVSASMGISGSAKSTASFAQILVGGSDGSNAFAVISGSGAAGTPGKVRISGSLQSTGSFGRVEATRLSGDGADIVYPAGHVLQMLHFEDQETNAITETYTNYYEKTLTLKSASSDVFVTCMYPCSVDISGGFGVKILRCAAADAPVDSADTVVWDLNVINNGSPLTEYNDQIWNMRVSSVQGKDTITGMSAGDTLHYGLFFERYDAAAVQIPSDYDDGWFSMQLMEVQK